MLLLGRWTAWIATGAWLYTLWTGDARPLLAGCVLREVYLILADWHNRAGIFR
jgi:hypothetical protein